MRRQRIICGCLLLLAGGCAGTSDSVRPPPIAPASRPSEPVEPVESVELRPNKSIEKHRSFAEKYRPLVEEAAQRHDVPPALVLGIIYVESRFDPRCHSPEGARGLMQLMPATAAKFGRRRGNPYDPVFNIKAGTAYLAHLFALFSGDEHAALAAYKMGERRVRRWVKQDEPFPPKAERYVRRVRAAALAFSSQ